MAHAHFTARWVAAVPAPPQGQVDYFDQTPPSLGLRVAPSGRKTWFVMYRASGRLRRYTLGTYPAVSLADARQRATDARHSVAHGGDPAQARQESRQAPTVAELGAQYLDLYAKVQKKSWREDARYLATDVLPASGPAQSGGRAPAGRRRPPGPDRRPWSPHRRQSRPRPGAQTVELGDQSRLPSACPEDLFGHGIAPSPRGRGDTGAWPIRSVVSTLDVHFVNPVPVYCN